MAEFLVVFIGGLFLWAYVGWGEKARTERLERETLESLAERADKKGEIWMPQSSHWGTWVCNLIDQGLLEVGYRYPEGRSTEGFLKLTDAGREALCLK